MSQDVLEAAPAIEIDEALLVEDEVPPQRREPRWSLVRQQPHQCDSIEDIVAAVHERWTRLGQASGNLWARRKGVDRVLNYLAEQPGATWQDRWESSPLSAMPWGDVAGVMTPAGSRNHVRNQTTAGLSALLVLGVIRPSFETALGMKQAHIWSKMLTEREDPDGAVLEAPTGAPMTRHHATAVLGRILMLTGMRAREVTAEDLLEYRAAALMVRKQVDGLKDLWRLLMPLGTITTDWVNPHRVGQQTVTQLVDRYRVASPRIRSLFINYLTRRQAGGIDYNTLRSLTRILVSTYWKVIEDIQPGIDTLDIPEDTFEEFLLRHRVVVGKDGTERERTNYQHELMQIRSFYKDLQEWAHAEPSRWAEYACRVPIQDHHIGDYSKYRKRLRSTMHQRTRERAPLLNRLADAAEQRYREVAELVAAAAAAQPGDELVVGARTYRRHDSGAMGRHLSVMPVDEPDARRIDLVHLEEDAFWAFAVIEVLRHTGVRIEELLELTQLDLIDHEHDGVQVVLLHVNPSKTDEERMLVAAPELVGVIAQMMRRIRNAAGATGQALPLVSAWDYNEAEALDPMPMLFQRTAGRGLKDGGTRPMTRKYVYDVLAMTCDHANLTANDGTPLRFTPHDFRRIFATDALSSGIPPHIIMQLMGHSTLATTQHYMAIFPEDVIRAHRTFVDERRTLRRSDYRPVEQGEWDEFNEHFGKRQIAIGSCVRAYGTDCVHEYACEQCQLARPDEESRPRLERVRDNLIEQIEEATERGWRGEIERLTHILSAVNDKIGDLDRAARRIATVMLPTPRLRVQSVE